MSNVKMQVKIEHEMDFMDDGEHYVFYIKRSDEPETAWGVSIAFSVVDGTMMSTGMIEHIHYLLSLGYELIWKGRKQVW